MKSLRTFILTACCVSLLSCDVANQAATLANCKYEFAGLSKPTVAGIDFSNIQSTENLNPTTLLKLTSAYMSGTLPFSTTVQVRATNPNASKAEIEGLEWALDLENKNLVSGMVDQRISVPANGGQTLIPVAVNVNVMDLIAGDSKDNVLNLVNSLLNVGESSSKVSVRVKPYMMVAGQKVSTGFVTLSHTVK